MPHNVPPTPPPKKRPSFFKKNFSASENNIQKVANGLSLEAITSHPHVTPTVSIHRTSEHHSSSSSDHTNHAQTHHANGIHNRAHQAILQKTNHTTTTHNSVLTPAAKPENARAPSPPRVKASESQLTLKQQNRSIGDSYLVNAWKKCQFIDTILYAYSDSDAETSFPIPAHKILLQSYSGFCLKFFSVYPFTSSALQKGVDSIGEPFKSNDFCPSPEMTQLEIQRLSGNQIPILSIPIPFYDLLKLVTLMYIGEVTIEKQNLDSVQRSAVVLKMNNINIVELGEMLIDSTGRAPTLSIQNDNNSSKSAGNSSEGSYFCSSNSNRTSTSSPELNIEAVSPSPPFIGSTMSEGISLDLRTSPPQITPMPKLKTTASPLPTTTPTIPITNVPMGERLQRLQHPQQLQQHHHIAQTTIAPQTPSLFDFLMKSPSASLFTPYFSDLMTPPITPSTAGTSCSSGSSGSSGSQYPATPSIIQQNPFFSNAFFSNLLTTSQMMNRQLSAPATLATNQIEGHSSPSLYLNNAYSKSASADEAGGSSPTHNGPPNRKRTQNLVHAAQYRDRRRQKIEQLYAEKDREEAKVNEQRNVIQKLCSQIEKLIDAQTRLSGEDGNTYRCPICSQNFGQLSAIRVHLNTAHPEKTCSSGPLSNAVVDPVSGQLHLRPPYRHSERDQKLLSDWFDAQKIAHDNYFSQQQSKQQQSKILLESHIAHTSSMLIS